MVDTCTCYRSNLISGKFCYPEILGKETMGNDMEPKLKNFNLKSNLTYNLPTQCASIPEIQITTHKLDCFYGFAMPTA